MKIFLTLLFLAIFPTSEIVPIITNSSSAPVSANAGEVLVFPQEKSPETSKQETQDNSLFTGQEPTEEPPKNDETAAATDVGAAVPLKQQELLVLVNEAKPSQIIVYKPDGTWWSAVRELQVTFDIEKGTMVGTAVFWNGPIRPPTPRKMDVNVKQLKSTTEALFFKKIEELNK